MPPKGKKNRLARNVLVGGKWYGPAHGTPVPPAEVAREITNPGAWADERPPKPKAPSITVKAEGEEDEGPEPPAKLSAAQLAASQEDEDVPTPHDG